MPAFFFKMMMKRSHQKYPLAMGHLKVTDLHNHRQGLHHKYPANNGQQKFLLDDDRNGT